MTMRLQEKVAIVMGAGQAPGETEGNGRAIARMFAEHGAKVVCVDRSLERAEETAALIGDAAMALRCDVSDRAECVAAIDAATGRWGTPDILVNNVGIGGRGDGPAHLIKERAYEKIMDVNVRGTLNGIAVCVPMMRERGSGSIINISSIAAVSGDDMVAYEMSKAAVNRLTISTALANAKHRIRVNAIAPGLMDTPMAVDAVATLLKRERSSVSDARNRRVPLGAQMGMAIDTAYAALFLASEESAFVTGVILPVDGGLGSRVG